MKSCFLLCGSILLTSLLTNYSNAGESIVEISNEGAIYESDSGSHRTVAWEKLSPVEKNTIRTKHNTELVNAICDARYVKGTVFHANKDGVVVQIDLTDEEFGIEGYHQGARVLKGGIILISDLPLDVPRSTGDPINVIAYFKEKSTFDMGIAAQEIEHLTTAKPDWFSVTDWTNSAGATMQAKLLGVSPEGKVLFLKNGKRMVITLSQLDAASQAKAKKVQARLAKFPVPSA